MKRLQRIVLGIISLTIGATILIGCVYSFFAANESFQFSLIELPLLLFPMVLIWTGWSWVRGNSPQVSAYSSELTVTLKLSDSDFGTDTERQAILAMKHRLEEILRDNELAEIDGEEFGNGECNIFIQTNSPIKAKNVIHEYFLAQGSTQNYTLIHSDI